MRAIGLDYSALIIRGSGFSFAILFESGAKSSEGNYFFSLSGF